MHNKTEQDYSCRQDQEYAQHQQIPPRIQVGIIKHAEKHEQQHGAYHGGGELHLHLAGMVRELHKCSPYLTGYRHAPV